MENIFDINLQLFAEEEAAAAGAESSNADGAETGEKSGKQFTQAEVEEIINKRFAKLQRDAEKRVEQARKDGMTEGEKLASMSAEERERAQREQTESDFKAREDALKQREAEVARKELRAQAVETLNGKGLPAGLADLLVYTDAEACNASIATVEKAFRDAVKAEVDKRLASSAAPLNRGSAAGAEQPKDKGVELAEKIGSSAKKSNEAYKAIIDKYR